MTPAADRLSARFLRRADHPTISLVCIGLSGGSARSAHTRPVRGLDVGFCRTILPCQSSVSRAHDNMMLDFE